MTVAESHTDPAGTCHLVSCPGKGTVDEHVRIGAPDTFAPYQAPPTPAKVLVEQADVAWLLDLVAGMKSIQTELQREVCHRVSRALAVARNSTGAPA